MQFDRLPNCRECGTQMDYHAGENLFRCPRCGFEYLIKSTFSSVEGLKSHQDGKAKVFYFTRESGTEPTRLPDSPPRPAKKKWWQFGK